MQIVQNVGKTGAKILCVCGNVFEVKYKYDAAKSPIGFLCSPCKKKISNMGAITQQKLQEVYDYNEETGEFKYRITTANGFAGDLATQKHSAGYLSVAINKKSYLAHRIIFFYKKGYWPEMMDHINHIKSDNRWCNLREVNNQENTMNLPLQKNSATGVMGVCLHRPTGKYRAYIMVNRKHIHLGLFETIEEAKAVRLAASKQYNFHKNHGKVATLTK